MGSCKIRYELFRERRYYEDIGWYDTYSVRDKKGRASVRDITVDLKEALEILYILNTENVSPVHLKDVIEDLLN